MSDLETVLRSLPKRVDWPEPSPHLAQQVVARIEPAVETGVRRRWAMVVTLAALVLVIGLIPDSRQAVADLFHEAGVRIGFIEETPADLAEDLDLGEPLTTEAATRQVGFELHSPVILGLPDGVYLDGDAVNMVWDGPVVLTQRAEGGSFAQKGLGPGTEATGVVVSGEPGLWIEGAEHTFTLLDQQGNPKEETTRLAANVLLWSSDGVDFRLELTSDLDRAMEIAGSMNRSE